jgi:hypothetical protein
VIPYVGWAVGVGLLVWDLWEGSQGALPTIRDALQAEEVKQEVRAEITSAVEEGVAAEVESLASTLALTLVGQWHEFCAGHGDICRLAAEQSDFRALLDNLPVADLTRLVLLVDFFWNEFGAVTGEERFLAAVSDGTLAMLMAAPPLADTILEATASPATTLAWVELAGDQLARVAELRLHETIDPLRMTTLSLAALLAIDDNAIIHKLRLLPIEQLLILLRLPTAELKQIPATATPDELGWLAAYLATLPEKDALAVAHALASGETTIAGLQAPPVAVADADGVDAALSGAANGQRSTEESSPAAKPEAEMPEAAVTVWTLLANSGWAGNGVAVAAGVVVLLLIAVGVVMALRREITDPPV